MTKIERTQLVIAGGGPVGLLAALCAAKRGLEVVVLERSFRGTPRGHTTLLHPSSLRLLGELGLSPLLLRSGQLFERLELRVDGNKQQIKLPFPVLSITQALFEETLLQVLRKEEVDLRATCEVTAIVQAERYVEVKAVRRERLRGPSATQDEHWELTDSNTIQAQFMIGADGHASHVRQSLGIRSDVGPTESYAMFEFPSEAPPAPELVITGGVGHLLTPLLERSARASFQLASASQPVADLALLAKLLRERAPQQQPPLELHWSSVVEFKPALAEAFGRGRVWLAGDAAHTTGPLGVQSMNRGLGEAYQMVEAIAAVDAGKSPLATLQALGNAQREQWLRTHESGAPLAVLPHAPAWLSGCARRVASSLPVSGPDLKAVFDQLGLAPS
ncbi:MAG TPA: NAD(P)/FAD-dependent oxidoreductase [Polyangiaceae bacterium]|nr:NAD(P)/FAD-dependent oxidoreductase [Polyangiaceae bacterium]